MATTWLAAVGVTPVTWAEFIEAGLLRMYRRDRSVLMAELRTFIDRLRRWHDLGPARGPATLCVAGSGRVIGHRWVAEALAACRGGPVLSAWRGIVCVGCVEVIAGADSRRCC
jgi:hypothetical protein